MIPLQLTIEGLFSYQEAQTIDFSTLCETRLFGIFGAVGSGKSSILEAIMFALYNKTDRLSYANQAYNMMNLRSDRLYIDFIFEASGKEYRFTVEGKRNSKDFEKINTFDRNAYLKRDGDWEPLPFHVADDILGLSYDNFRRTIIIPQGKFQEFLQLGEKDRTQMMKEIFRLDRFDLKDAAGLVDSENNSKLENVTGQLVTLEDADDDKMKALLDRKEALKKEIGAEKKEMDTKRKEREGWKERKRSYEEWKVGKQKLEELRNGEEGYLRRKANLERLDTAREKLAVPLDRLESAEKQLASIEEVLKKTKEAFRGTELELKDHKERVDKLSISKEEDEKEKMIIADLGLLANIRRYEKEMLPVAVKKKKLDEQLAQLNKQAEPIEGEKEQLEKERKSIIGSVGPVEAISSWLTRIEMILGDGEKLKLKRKEQQGAEEAWNKQLMKIDWPGKPDEIEFGDYPEAVNAGLRNAEKQLEEARQRQLNLSKEELAREWRSQLEDGKPCPVCGAVHHPATGHEGPSETGSKENKMAELELVRAQWKKAEEEIRRLWPEGQVMQKQKQSIDEDLKQISEEFLQLRSAYPAEGVSIPDDKGEFRKFIQELKDKVYRQSKIGTRLEELSGLEKTTAREKEDLEDQKKAIEAEWIRLETMINDARSKLQVLEGGENWLERSDPAELAKEKLAEREDREQKLKKSANAVTELEKTLYGYQQLITGHETEKVELVSGIEKQRSALLKLIAELGFGDIDKVRQLLSSEIDPARERKEIEDYFQELNNTIKQVNDLQKILADQPYDPEAHAIFEQDFTARETRYEELMRQEAMVEAQSERMASDLQKKKALLKEKATLENRAENIKTLKRLFRSAGFVNYISRVYLENICNAANERFTALTRRQLALQLNEKNEFEVIDFLNEGKVRSIRTLSGGQTFQASLCLALALAESVQAQAKTRQNFFFLDEGFGSLDRDSLEVVFKTLKSLRKEHRIVGIISHVEELQQEIQSYVHIERDPEKGSRILYSWE